MAAGCQNARFLRALGTLRNSKARKGSGSIGDPRQPNVDMIDWIEHIPYDETRNYVMRVLEAVTVYRMRIRGGGSSRPTSELLA